MRLLLHVCCGPCLCEPLAACRQEGVEVEGLFYNPNIHPFLEFRRRLKSLKVLAERERLALSCDESYGLAAFLPAVRGEWPTRCRACYRMRLTRTAEEAKRRGFDAFSTTLLVSPSQEHAALRQVAQQVAEQVGIDWWYRDWRSLYPASLDRARRLSLYRQQYCGCIWSEYERYRDSRKHVFRGSTQ